MLKILIEKELMSYLKNEFNNQINIKFEDFKRRDNLIYMIIYDIDNLDLQRIISTVIKYAQKK